jgi:phosphatidylserine/phosphatidylglycerophosphate/cardiolipin synthase-like enzyme
LPRSFAAARILYRLILVGAAALVLCACVENAVLVNSAIVSTQAPAGQTISTPAISAYFTDPDGGTPANQNGLPDAVMINDLDQAQTSIDVAMYNFSLENVAQALIHAKQRGVAVRLVTESDALDGGVFAELSQHGISAVGDRHEGLMHDKFLVIDKSIVWTGSLNLTGSGLNNDNNNAVRIASPEAAAIYTSEFEKMAAKDQFGPDRPHSPAADPLDVGGNQLQIYFSPDQSASPRLVEALRGAKHSIEFLAYSFTSEPIASAVIAQAKAGVAVRGVMEQSQESNQGGQYAHLRKAGIDVWLDKNPGLLHHKVMILDHETVVFGSYNFTASADKTNDENVIVLRDPQIAQQFLAEFERVYQIAKK